jgi:acyl-CoA thioester hydrolase/thioesterase-3
MDSTQALPGRTRFETDLQVRPDDLDMNRHVHASRYLDYVLAARYDQMQRCYRMSMEEFLKLGYGWVIRTAHIDYKRPLGLGEQFTVVTWVQAFARHDVEVHFEIHKRPSGKRCCDGFFHYTMIKLATGRAEPIPSWIIDKYAI